MPQTQMLPGPDTITEKKVWYEGSDTIYPGYLVCYNRDYGTAATSEPSRGTRVEKPSAANLHNFAGVVRMGRPTGYTGPCEVPIVVPDANGVVCNIFAAEACTLGTTLLTVQPGSYVAGGIGEGIVIAKAAQTVDRSSTNGLVLAEFVQPKILLPTVERLMYGNGLSSFWNDCPCFDYPGKGVALFEDFSNLPSGVWTATQATAGTWALDTSVPGVCLADCNSGTQHQGINVQRTGGPVIVPLASTVTYFEARIKVVDTAITPQLLVGLATVDTTALPSGAVSNTTCTGGFTVLTTGAGAVTFSHQRGGTGGTSLDLATTLVEATYITLGFKLNGLTSGELWVDGTQLDATTYALTAADIPNAAMVPTFVCQTDSTTDPILHVDWFAVAQTFA